MHNVVLSPIDPEKLISDISERVTANILNAVINQKSSSTEQSDQLLTVPETAIFLDLAEPTIYTKNSRGQLPSIKPPGSKRIYFLKSDLIEYLKKSRRKTNAEITGEAESYLKKKGGNHV